MDNLKPYCVGNFSSKTYTENTLFLMGITPGVACTEKFSHSDTNNTLATRMGDEAMDYIKRYLKNGDLTAGPSLEGKLVDKLPETYARLREALLAKPKATIKEAIGSLNLSDFDKACLLEYCFMFRDTYKAPYNKYKPESVVADLKHKYVADPHRNILKGLNPYLELDQVAIAAAGSVENAHDLKLFPSIAYDEVKFNKACAIARAQKEAAYIERHGISEDSHELELDDEALGFTMLKGSSYLHKDWKHFAKLILDASDAKPETTTTPRTPGWK